MTNNIMLEYIKITQKEILEYMKLIFGNQYSNKLALRYMDAYLNVRFYNFYPKDNNLPFRKNYLNAIKEEEASILRSMPEKQKLVEHMGLFFYYILYFDKISYKVDIDEMIEKLYKMRKKILGKDEQNFKDKFYNIYTSYLNEKEAFALEREIIESNKPDCVTQTNRVQNSYDQKFNKSTPLKCVSSSGIEHIFGTPDDATEYLLRFNDKVSQGITIKRNTQKKNNWQYLKDDTGRLTWSIVDKDSEEYCNFIKSYDNAYEIYINNVLAYIEEEENNELINKLNKIKELYVEK